MKGPEKENTEPQRLSQIPEHRFETTWGLCVLLQGLGVDGVAEFWVYATFYLD